MTRGRPHGRSKSDHRVCQAARHERAAEYIERIGISAEQQEARIAAVNAECEVQDGPCRRRSQKSGVRKNEAPVARGSARSRSCKGPGRKKKRANERPAKSLGKPAERGWIEEQELRRLKAELAWLEEELQQLGETSSAREPASAWATPQSLGDWASTSMSRSLIATLLMIGGIEGNPGPTPNEVAQLQKGWLEECPNIKTKLLAYLTQMEIDVADWKGTSRGDRSEFLARWKAKYHGEWAEGWDVFLKAVAGAGTSALDETSGGTQLMGVPAVVAASPQNVAAWTDEAQTALARLELLARKLGLSGDVDGFSTLLLTGPKLKLLLSSRLEPGRELPDNLVPEMMERIRTTASPLKLAADLPSEPLSTAAELGEWLHPVDRDAEYLSFVKQVMEWEAGKTEKAIGAAGVTRNNLFACGHFNGQGKTTFGDIVANPPPELLEKLRMLLRQTPRHGAHLHWILGCLRINVRLSSLKAKDVGKFGSHHEALASLIWDSFLETVEREVRADASLTGSLQEPLDAIEAIRSLVGDKCGLLIQFDDAQVLGRHAEVGGWFQGEVEPMDRKVSPPKSQKERAVEDRKSAVLELAGVYGVWEAVREICRKKGVFLMMSGRSVVPYLLGKKYLSSARKPSNSPGKVFLIGLRPISMRGLCQVLRRTKCDNGQTVLEALGFNMEALSDLETSGRLDLELDPCEPKPPSFEAMLDAVALGPSARQEAGREGEASDSRRSQRRKAPAVVVTSIDAKRTRVDSAEPSGAVEAVLKRSMLGASNQPVGDASSLPGVEGVEAEEEPGAEAEKAGKSSSTGEPSDAAAGVGGHPGVGAEKDGKRVVSVAAERLEQFVKLALWITCGVPLLVRIVLQRAVQTAQKRAWALLGPKEMSDSFRAKGTAFANDVIHNERTIKEIDFRELGEAERVQLLLRAALRVETPLDGKDVLTDAVIRAAVYTRPPLRQTELCSPNKAAADQEEVLSVVPQLPPPLLRNLALDINLPGALLARALELEPGFVEPGRTLEAVTRLTIAGILLGMRQGDTVATAFPFLAEWEPAQRAHIRTPTSMRAVPGFSDKESVLGSNPSAEDLKRVLDDPWADMVSHEDARHLLALLGDAAVGVPAPNSAGSDLFFQGFLDGGSVLLCFQLKAYLGLKSRIGVVDVQKEIGRTKGHLASIRKGGRVKGALLIYMVLGPGVTKEVEAAAGQLLSPGTHGGLVVPPGLPVYILTAQDVHDLLGADCIAAFQELHDKSRKYEPGLLERLVQLLGYADDGGAP